MRVVPAQQGLEAADSVLPQVEQWLVVEFEKVAGQSFAEVDFQSSPRLKASIHSRLEEPPGSAAIGLGAVEGHVSVLQQFGVGTTVARRERDADAQADRHAVAVGIEEVLHRVGDPPREDCGIFGDRAGRSG